MFDITAIGLVITALLAYLNHRFLKLPMTIGVMSIALMLSVVLIGLAHLGFGSLLDYEARALRSIDFTELLMQGMLSLLLFAGALHVDLRKLRAFRWQVATLAFLGTLISTVLIGAGLIYVLPLLGIDLPPALCYLFGALISPTDPIAVMNMLHSARASQNLSTVIAGESLFNDGVGVVLFTLIAAFAFGGHKPTVAGVVVLFLWQVCGGIAFGALLGLGTRYLLRTIDGYQEEVLVSLAAVVGGYAVAGHLHVSGPLATVVVGVLVGNRDRVLVPADSARPPLDLFWELVDAILNAVLFVLLGLEIIMVPLGFHLLLAWACAVFICLAARWLSVGLPVRLLRESFNLPRRSGLLLTWGGLRGGISVALALSLPTSEHRDLLISMTYSVVVVSILIQGLSFGSVAKRCVA